MGHLLKIQLNQSTLATLLVLLFIVPSFLPIAGADDAEEASTSARSGTLDFTFRDALQLSNSGSAILLSNLYLEPGDHIVTANVSYTGTGDDNLQLVLQHKGSSILDFADVPGSTIDFGTLYGNSAGSQIDIPPNSFTWTASSGAGQELRVKIIGTQESGINLLDNIQPLGLPFSVEYKQKGDATPTNFPAISPASSQMTLSKSNHLLNVTATNSGVISLNAQLSIVLTQNGTPGTLTYVSTQPLLEPGSYPLSSTTLPDQAILTAALDASSLTGVYEFVATVTFTGLQSETITVSEPDTWVKFSDYNADVIEPSTLIVEPGESAVLTFLVENTGELPDLFSFVVTESETPGWVSVGDVPDFGATINKGQIRLISIPVNVPADAVRSATDTITVTFTSASSPPYTIVATGRVMVGDFFDGTVTLITGVVPKPITPGGSENFIATVENTGSVATSFSLLAGFSVNALNWTININTATTPVIASGATHQVSITVTAPPIQNPIVTSEHNMADDVLSIWIQSQPSGGGVPVVDQTSLKVEPAVVLDPGLSTEPYEVTNEEIEAMMSGTVFSQHPEMNIRVVHNLPVNLVVETLDAVITVEKSFTARNDGGFSEVGRWDLTVSNPILTGFNPGDTLTSALNIAGPQANQYPLAGTFSAAVTITPSPNPALLASGVTALPFTQIYDVIVPSIVKGEFLDIGPYDINVGKDNAIPMRFANAGNDASSYRLRVVNDLPENWTANFSDTDSLITGLTSDLADGTIDANIPGGNVTHMKIVTFNVKSDPLAPAGLHQPIRIRIEDPVSGQLLEDEFVFDVIVGQVFNATLSPTNQTLHMDVLEDTFTSIYIRNTGNAPTDYTIALDTSLAGAVVFEIESPTNSKIFIAAGFEEAIRIKMTANSDANADGVYMATVLVSANDGQIALSANIVANISELHSFSITAPTQMSVTPGLQEKVEFEIVNNGNSEETVTVNFTVQGNLTLSVYSMTVTLPIGGSVSDQVIVFIPSLGGTDSLVQGDSYNLTITVYNGTSNVAYPGSKSVQLLVQPLFIAESSDWPSEMEFRPQALRTWEVTLTNTGNQDVTVNVYYMITRPGFTNTSSTDWEMVTENSLLVLPRNTPVVHSFTVRGNVANPLLSLTADLTLHLQPETTADADGVNTTVDGKGEFSTQLIMSRFYSTGEIGLQPALDDGPVLQPIPYSNIPISNGSAVAYQVELCNAVRLKDIASLGQNPLNYSWGFTLIETKADGTTVPHPLDLEQECGKTTSLGPTSRYNLPLMEPWNPGTFTLEIDIPNRGSILPGDGWDLTFRLYHPDENAGYTQFNETTFTLVLAVFADPMVMSIELVDDLEEGSQNTVTVVIQNVGSAKALDVSVHLQCDGLTVSTSAEDTPSLIPGSVGGGINKTMIKEFGPGDTKTLQWGVTADSIDWWLQKTDVTCTATVTSFNNETNVEGNDEKVFIGEVTSWSPGVQNSFIACVACLLVSLILFRLTAQNDNFRLLGIYSGVLSLGFSFHLFGEIWWGFAVLGLSALWIWRVSWGSTEEFRLLHEDYQRARKGVSTLYADHFDELGKARRQLVVILAVPVLGMLAIVLGIPPTLTIDSVNMISLVSYVAVVIIGVWILINRADSMYGTLYGRLTDIEVKSIRLERDLGDPARLFNELAADGLNLAEIFGDVEPSRSLNPEAIFSNEEVNDDA